MEHELNEKKTYPEVPKVGGKKTYAPDPKPSAKKKGKK